MPEFKIRQDSSAFQSHIGVPKAASVTEFIARLFAQYSRLKIFSEINRRFVPEIAHWLMSSISAQTLKTNEPAITT
jgi:hypothetical protein